MRTVTLLFLLASPAFANPPAADPALVKQAVDAATTGLTMKNRGEVRESKRYFDTCIAALGRVEAAVGHKGMRVSVHTEYGDRLLFELKGLCERSAREATEARPRRESERPHFTLVVSSQPGGQAQTEFRCGEPVYASVQFTRARASGLTIGWSIDGERRPNGPDVTLDSSGSIDLTKGHSGERTFGILPDPAAMKSPMESTYFYYRDVAGLAAGDHHIRLVAGDWDAPYAEATFSLTCPDGPALYRASLDKLRHAYLAQVKWPVSPAKLVHWQSQLTAITAMPDEISHHNVSGAEKLLAVSAMQEGLDKDERGRPKQRVVEFYAGFELADGTCLAIPGAMLEDYDLEQHAFGPPRAVLSRTENQEILCSELRKHR